MAVGVILLGGAGRAELRRTLKKGVLLDEGS
jgi:hypothetical protein